ncbi:MAG: tRNA dihydrouridine synthase DusB [Ancalomicrobiaceae bacterium]|nr:tRNA dihydrouridine synthase DusB [Ancalomicrobiaceae bacterium]
MSSATSLRFPQPVRLGRFGFDRPVMLAPMSGITDLPFRRLAASFGADMVVTEMVASESWLDGDADMALRSAGEGISPHVVQLAGREARWMGEAARAAEANGADIIDINMGCPAKRVTTGWSGAALMRDLDHALGLIEAVVGAVSVPVTLKMRLGWDRASVNAPELARRAEAAGVAMVTVHGRTRDEFYEGRADWEAIARVRDRISIPLIANGDVADFADAEAILGLSGADGLMIGRGACGRPWLPAAIARYFRDRECWFGPTGDELADVVVAHHRAVVDHYGPFKGVLAARKHLGWYVDAAIARVGGAARTDAAAIAELRSQILRATEAHWIESGVRALLSLIERAGDDAAPRSAADRSIPAGRAA